MQAHPRSFVGTTLDSFLIEEGIYSEVIAGAQKNMLALVRRDTSPDAPKHSKALALLDEYAAAKDREKYGLQLAKTYNKRRQLAYAAYLREYDKLRKDPSFDQKIRDLFTLKLDEIHRNFNQKF